MWGTTLAVAAVAISTAIACTGQQSDVRVLLLDYRTGQPIRRHVTVGLLLSDQDGRVRNNSVQVFRKTDRNGVAVFHLNPPRPPSIWTMVSGLSNWPCSNSQELETSEIQTVGIVERWTQQPLCSDHAVPPTDSRPGTVFIFVRHLNVRLKFLRIWYELFEF